ncbi:MAG: hypothetical protein HY897_19370 [Deltaproteobacteria bacterium]|nr:hypothetical protein [Deltaproteobacteria bacterium]
MGAVIPAGRLEISPELAIGRATPRTDEHDRGGDLTLIVPSINLAAHF